PRFHFPPTGLRLGQGVLRLAETHGPGWLHKPMTRSRWVGTIFKFGTEVSRRDAPDRILTHALKRGRPAMIRQVPWIIGTDGHTSLTGLDEIAGTVNRHIETWANPQGSGARTDFGKSLGVLLHPTEEPNHPGGSQPSPHHSS